MKTLIILALIASAAVTVQAQDWKLKFPATKAQFVKVQMKWAEKDPNWNPTKEKLEARFDELDKDGDGKLTKEEFDAK